MRQKIRRDDSAAACEQKQEHSAAFNNFCFISVEANIRPKFHYKAKVGHEAKSLYLLHKYNVLLWLLSQKKYQQIFYIFNDHTPQLYCFDLV